MYSPSDLNDSNELSYSEISNNVENVDVDEYLKYIQDQRNDNPLLTNETTSPQLASCIYDSGNGCDYGVLEANKKHTSKVWNDKASHLSKNAECMNSNDFYHYKAQSNRCYSNVKDAEKDKKKCGTFCALDVYHLGGANEECALVCDQLRSSDACSGQYEHLIMKGKGLNKGCVKKKGDSKLKCRNNVDENNWCFFGNLGTEGTIEGLDNLSGKCSSIVNQRRCETEESNAYNALFMEEEEEEEILPIA